MEKRLPKIIRFASRVLRDFFLRNHGLLLTAAVAYHMMLSRIPLSAVLRVLFSRFIDPPQLMEAITIEVSLIAPGFGPTLTGVLTEFLRTREIIGWDLERSWSSARSPSGCLRTPSPTTSTAPYRP
jgi:uncharacterized BrkB/YihY/UPF0761 family membrane protein